jgi:hypothetical protein
MGTNNDDHLAQSCFAPPLALRARNKLVMLLKDAKKAGLPRGSPALTLEEIRSPGTQANENDIYIASIRLMLRRLDRRQTVPNFRTATRSLLRLEWAYLYFKIGLWIASQNRISLK